MISVMFQELRELQDVVVHPGADAQAVYRCETESSFRLPTDHKKLLFSSNGIEAYAGYLRMFGLYTAEACDAVRWNQEDYWKFAWGDRCADYWCFAETAWGDQFAYRMESLRMGRDETVFFLDSMSMRPEVVASSFCEFLEKEFIRTAKVPYDAMLRSARQKFGPIELGTHLVYAPSVLLGGSEDIRNVVRINARAAMICNGDIAEQLDAGPLDRTIKALLPYVDNKQRQRIRLVWE